MNIATSPSNCSSLGSFSSSSSMLLITCTALYPLLSAVYLVILATPFPGPTHLMNQVV